MNEIANKIPTSLIMIVIALFLAFIAMIAMIKKGGGLRVVGITLLCLGGAFLTSVIGGLIQTGVAFKMLGDKHKLAAASQEVERSRISPSDSRKASYVQNHSSSRNPSAKDDLKTVGKGYKRDAQIGHEMLRDGELPNVDLNEYHDSLKKRGEAMERLDDRGRNVLERGKRLFKRKNKK